MVPFRIAPGALAGFDPPGSGFTRGPEVAGTISFAAIHLDAPGELFVATNIFSQVAIGGAQGFSGRAGALTVAGLSGGAGIHWKRKNCSLSTFMPGSA